MKRVAFIAVGYIVKYDGISVYTENLLREILVLKNDETFIDIYLPQSAAKLFIKRVFADKIDDTIKLIDIKDSNNLIKAFDLQKKVLFEAKYDLVFAPNPMPLFFGGEKRIKVIHDLTIKRTPELFSKIKHIYIDFLIAYMQRFDDSVGYISKQTKEDILKFYPIKKGKKMLYLPNGIPFKVRDKKRAKIEDLYGKYSGAKIEFIVVGRINRSKGFDRILKFLKFFDAFVKNSDFHDVVVHIVGKQTKESEEIFQNFAFENIVLNFHGFLDDYALNGLYKKSGFCFFLSRNEGYGLPLVEAMWHRVIPIVSDIPVFGEILSRSYPKFNDNIGYEEAIKDFIVKIYTDKEYLYSIMHTIEEAVEREKKGYKKAARNLLEYLYEKKSAD